MQSCQELKRLPPLPCVQMGNVIQNGQVFPAPSEGVQLMNVGAKYKFYVPADLAYGARSTGKISSHSSLIFEVELLKINDTGN